MVDSYWEVKFPSDKMQVPSGWSKQQATDAIKQALNEYIEQNVVLVEPEPDIPEGIEVTFGDATTEKEVANAEEIEA